jgi:serine/threonine protein kinase
VEVIRTLAPGSKISDFEIIAQLRTGGMASFYLARRMGPAGFSRPVGIKVIHDHLAADRSFVEMFLDEARLSARIVHPNVVHVEELGESEGMFFLAMEYVHGTALSVLLRRLASSGRRLAPEVACAIARGVADGLHAAHEAKDERGNALEVVHRDVSPQNILVSAQGHVKLIDFGVAKSHGRIQETESGSFKGKLSYMSPEQAWARPIDRRTDVYALGVVLWELLTGRRLFAGSNEIEILERVRNPEVPPPSKFDSAINPSLDHVVLTALSIVREARFDTAQSFRRAIGNACPASLSVEAETLGVLLETEVGDEMASERELLQRAFEASVVSAPEPDAEVARLSTTLVNPRLLRDALSAEHPLIAPPAVEDAAQIGVAKIPPTANPTPKVQAKIPPTANPTPKVQAKIPPTANPTPRVEVGARDAVERAPEIPATVVRRPQPASARAAESAPEPELARSAFVPEPTGRRLLWPIAAAAVAAVLGLPLLAWALGWFEPEGRMCDGVLRLSPADGVTISHRVDTGEEASAVATRDLAFGRHRLIGADHAPTVLREYLVPGIGPHVVDFSTINPVTHPDFDTLVVVYRRSCGDDLASSTFTPFDDPFEGSDDKRATGSLEANGGEVLTFALTAYGGSGDLDEGVMQLDVRARPR